MNAAFVSRLALDPGRADPPPGRSPIEAQADRAISAGRKGLKPMAAAIALLLLPSLAHAHPGHGPLDLATGLAHPFSGADHMLAMLSVGLWAALRGGRARLAWPAAFVGAMVAGFALGRLQPIALSVEPAILASVIVLGALTAAQARLPLAAGVTLIAAFGAAHGYAHGVEAPGSGLGFPIGFVLSTAALHALGLGAGAALQRFGRPGLVRLLGAGAAAGGLILAAC
jgi:urease accessory protein